MLKKLIYQTGMVFLLFVSPTLFSSSSTSSSFGCLVPSDHISLLHIPLDFLTIVKEISYKKKISITEYPEEMARIEKKYNMRKNDLAKIEMLESSCGKNTKHKTINDPESRVHGETAVGNFGFMPSTSNLPLFKGENFDPKNAIDGAEMTGRLYEANYNKIRKTLPNLSEHETRDLAIGCHKANVMLVIKMYRKGTDIKDITAGDTVREFIKKYKALKVAPDGRLYKAICLR